MGKRQLEAVRQLAADPEGGPSLSSSPDVMSYVPQGIAADGPAFQALSLPTFLPSY